MLRNPKFREVLFLATLMIGSIFLVKCSNPTGSTTTKGNATITITNPWNPTITFSGQSANLATGSSMTVTATVSSTPDSYAWYVDGTAISGATTNSVTFGSALAAGSHVATLIVKSGTYEASEQFSFTVGVSSSTATLTINPATVTGGTVGTSYSFVLTETSVPSGVTQVIFAWNFGDGSSSATGTATATVTNSQATTTISHTYTSQSSYGLSVTVNNGTTVLASATAPVVIGTATTRSDQLTALNTWTAAASGGEGLTVDIWDISSLPVGAKFDINYDMYSIPDKCIIEYPAGTVIWDSGWRGDSSYAGNASYPGGIAGAGAGEQDSLFTKGSTNSFKVTMVGGAPGTAWDYSMRAHL